MTEESPQPPNPAEITRLLCSWQDGDESALDTLMPLLYDELHRMSRNFLRKERVGHTLQPTALVNEAYLKLLDQNRANWKNRAHFLSIAAQIMRRILLNYWRERSRRKRGGDAEILPFEEALIAADNKEIDLDTLNEGLEKLEKEDPRKCKLVELKFFGGLSEQEMAEVLGVSVTTIRRDWKLARLWLFRFFGEGKDSK